MKSRILTLIVCMMFVLTLFAVPTYATEDDAVQFAAEISALKRFGIIEEDFNPDENITLGDFLGMAMELTGLTDVKASGEQAFSDVPASAKHYSAVMHAKNMGIISGLGDGSLGYNQKLTMDRACKILVSILGYEPHAQAKGGWSSGYIIIAGNEGILDGCKIDSSKPISAKDAAKLVYNCLEIDILQQEGYPEGSYRTYDGQNPLTKWMKIESVEGIVTGNKVTTISGEDELEDGIVTIDGERYAENGTLAGDYLGCKITAYYKEENSKKILLDISLSGEAKTYDISGDDIAPETTESKVYYYTSDFDKTLQLAIDPDAYIFYNYKRYNDAPSAKLFNPENGALKLIDYDGDKKADVVYVTESTVYVVESISYSNGKIVDKYGQKDITLFRDDDAVVEIVRNGVEISIKDIAINNVLTVTKSEDEKFIRVDVGYRKVKGEVSEKGNDYVVAKGKKYKILEQNKSVFDGIAPGTFGIVLLDVYGRGAGFIADSTTGGEYGYVFAATTRQSGLAEKAVGFKIYTMDGVVNTYEVSADVKVNGKRSNDLGEKYDADTLIAEFTTDITYNRGTANERTFTGVFDHQLIKYQLDESGKIISVEKAVLNCRDFGGSGKAMDAFSLDHDYKGWKNADTPVTHNYIYKSSGMLGNDFNLVEAKGIQIPNPSIWIDYYDGNISMSDLEAIFSRFTPYTEWPKDKTFENGSAIKLYDMDEMKKVKVIVTEGAKLSVNVAPYFMLVEEIVEVLDDDGLPATAIIGMYRGKYQRFIVDTTADAFNPDLWKEEGLLNLKPGDVIRIALSSTNEIINIFKIYTVNQESEWLLGRDADRRYVDVMTNFRDKSSAGYREYLLGGNEFHEFIFQNGETGDPYTVRFFPYCYWTGNGLIAAHVRSAYIKQGSMIVNPGVPYDMTEPVSEKIASFPGNSDTGENVRGSYYFDEATGKVREATRDDLEEDDSKSYVMRIRYGIVEDLIVIKHKEPITGYWHGWSETK